MTISSILMRCGAIALAASLLSLQILAALEYTVGGSFYTQASMIATMVTLAILPVFIEWARRAQAWGIALALVSAFVAFLAYSLPATIGRTGEIKEAKVVDTAKALEDQERVKADHVVTQGLVAEANRWQLKACKGGNGPDCKSATFILNQRQASLEKLAGQITAAKPVPTGDLGSENLAWATAMAGKPVPAEAIRKASGMSFAFGLDVVIWALVWFASSQKVASVGRLVASGLPVEKSKLPVQKPFLAPIARNRATDEDLVRKALSLVGRPVSNTELAELLQRSEGEASKMVSGLNGKVSKVRKGREVLISLPEVSRYN